jgi:hypothetical protein
VSFESNARAPTHTVDKVPLLRLDLGGWPLAAEDKTGEIRRALGDQVNLRRSYFVPTARGQNHLGVQRTDRLTNRARACRHQTAYGQASRHLSGTLP